MTTKAGNALEGPGPCAAACMGRTGWVLAKSDEMATSIWTDKRAALEQARV